MKKNEKIPPKMPFGEKKSKIFSFENQRVAKKKRKKTKKNFVSLEKGCTFAIPKREKVMRDGLGQDH
ncbi:MAG: hypothetical protein IJP95_02415 [Bacteroidales bacterium]|nr:hypothetical protein [Bacteroidales bacterium]